MTACSRRQAGSLASNCELIRFLPSMCAGHPSLVHLKGALRVLLETICDGHDFDDFDEHDEGDDDEKGETKRADQTDTTTRRR